MQVLILRHAQTVGNATGDYSTKAHDVLSDYGREQAARLAGPLAAYSFDAIYCSPLERAMMTIAPYLQANGRSAELWPELAEVCWQAERHTPIPQRTEPPPILTLEAALVEHFTCLNGHATLPYEDEVYQEGFARVDRAHRRLRQRHGGTADRVLVVGHWYLASRLVERLLDLPHLDHDRFNHDNTAVSCLTELPGGEFRVQYLNKVLI